MWPKPPSNAREAYYVALAELAIHRDLLQAQIGSYLQAAKELHERVAKTCPGRLERFARMEAATTEGLMDDLAGDEGLAEAEVQESACT